ncbi:MAG TPA: hypothetical protein VJJ21_02695 [Candidatus Nanoarchaeia archaeon]|nr:hypothetical protein [Candidatus Nanoarchaeia archaeon]
MDTKIITLILLGVVVSFVGLQSYQISSLKNTITGNVAGNIAGSSSGINTAGWTDNEKMNYEMHGTIPARAQTARVQTNNVPASSGMVGGC